MTSMMSLPKSILVKIKATHFNDFINRNALNYTSKAVNDGYKSWLEPFKKPTLRGHDKLGDPIGRIVGAQIARSDNVGEPADYIELTSKITDQAAIEKILDGRYETVSVGSRSSKVLCSECNQNIIEDGLCEHKKGSYSDKGKRVHWIIDQIDYVECSFVNEPADDWAGIDQIDVGFGFVPYKDFLDNRETILADLNQELSMTDAVLNAASRNKLPDSAFCYVAGSGDQKVRKFPAADAAHVRNGLARLSQAKLPESAKGKIMACLKRKAKRFGVEASSKDSLFTQDAVDYINALDPLYGLHDAWTAEEIKAVNDLFAAEPDFDVPAEDKVAPAEKLATDAVETDPEKMKKDELVVALKSLQDSTKLASEANTKKIKELEDKNAEQVTILTAREDEVNRYIDQVASLEKTLRTAIINNIVDLKKPDTNEDRATAVQKLESRQTQSLVDALADLRIETTTEKPVDNKDRVQDPTLQSGAASTTALQDANTKKDPWSIFGQDNRLVEVK